LADTPYHELVESNDYESEIKRMKDQFRAQPQGSPFITIMIAASLVNIQEAVARGEAQLAGVQSLLALRRFEIEHGYLAETLEEAVAETALATVPVDAFSGQPMRYVVSGEKLTVYSTGKDLKDDGGQTDWKYGEQPGDFLFAMTSRPETKPRPTEVSSETEPASTGSENEAASNTSREWTSTVGTKVAAKFAGLDGETALLLRADGQTIRVPLEKLIPADRDWIEKHGKGSSSP
jgi:hypothetical protein